MFYIPNSLEIQGNGSLARTHLSSIFRLDYSLCVPSCISGDFKLPYSLNHGDPECFPPEGGIGAVVSRFCPRTETVYCRKKGLAELWGYNSRPHSPGRTSMVQLWNECGRAVGNCDMSHSDFQPVLVAPKQRGETPPMRLQPLISASTQKRRLNDLY